MSVPPASWIVPLVVLSAPVIVRPPVTFSVWLELLIAIGADELAVPATVRLEAELYRSPTRC